MTPATDIIEGSFRVVASRDPAERPFRNSPNRQRTVARIVFWNAVCFAAVIFLPVLAG